MDSNSRLLTQLCSLELCKQQNTLRYNARGSPQTIVTCALFLALLKWFSGNLRRVLLKNYILVKKGNQLKKSSGETQNNLTLYECGALNILFSEQKNP